MSVLLLSCGSVALTAHVPIARAQESRDAGEPAAYRSTVREALSEYHAKNFPEARALFEEAHRLYPNARTLRGLGMTAFELRSYRESVSFLKSALESQVKPLDGNLRGETERLLARAERFVGKLTIHLTPESANVSIDGNHVLVSPDTPVVLDVGEHTFEFHAEGYLPESRSLYVKGRESETWTVVLNKVPAPVAAAPVAPSAEEVARASEVDAPDSSFVAVQERPTKQPLYKNAWLWTGVGVAVTGIVVTAVVLATRDPKLSSAQVGDNTPAGGVFSALEASP
ncbi:MAG TPA: PEGA domain-containing protein [Polyangiales bacterium]